MGGVGFVGFHLVEEGLKRRYKVIILDDLSTVRLGNIELLIEPSWHSDPERSEEEESPLRSG